MDWPAIFAEALPYPAFLDRHATPEHRARWDAMHRRIRLTKLEKFGVIARRLVRPHFI